MCCYHHRLTPVVRNSKQMTLHSRAHCWMSTADSKGPEMSVPFKRKKAFSLVLAALAREQIPREMRGNRGHLQGPSLLPLSFSILKCASVLNVTPSVLNSTGGLTSERRNPWYKAQWGEDSGAGSPGCLSPANEL